MIKLQQGGRNVYLYLEELQKNKQPRFLLLSLRKVFGGLVFILDKKCTIQAVKDKKLQTDFPENPEALRTYFLPFFPRVLVFAQ